MQGPSLIFGIAILILSVVIHEVSHGYAAYMMGDPTAKNAGRLTMNPIKHLDMMGSVIVPLLLVLFRSPFLFGWAKPVPYNPYNLKNQKWGPGIVAAAGPLSNFLTAGVFGLVSAFVPLAGSLKISVAANTIMSFGLQGGDYAVALYSFFVMIVWINVFLGIFNLVPIPPLDGSKVLFSFLPYRWLNIQVFLEHYGFFILVIFILFFS
ncbi:MAG: site-2 protease family protein, partial [Patescibacteria group bacterium]